MNEPMKVMIAYDGSSHSEAALDDVVRAGLPPDAEILIVSVADSSTIKPPVSEFDLFSLASRRASMVIERARAHTEREIEKVRKRASAAADRLRARFPEARIFYEVLDGKPAAEILRKAGQWKPDLIVAGSHGRTALGRFFLGSVSQKIAEQADCAVRIVRRASPRESEPVSIIAGADNLFAAEKLTRALGRRVWSGQTKLSLMIVADDSSETLVSDLDPKTTALFLQLAGELRLAGAQVSVEIKGGDLQQVLLAAAENKQADALFVAAGSAFHESGLNETAAELITDAGCTVEIVR